MLVKQLKNNIETLLSYWHFRIFALLFIWALGSAFYIFTGYSDILIALYLPLLLASIVIDALRKTNKSFLFGLHFHIDAPKEFFFGLAIAIINLVIIALIGLLFGAEFRITGKFDSSNFVFILAFMIYALGEELLYRGTIFQAIMEYFGKYLTIIIFCVIFSAAHFVYAEFEWIFAVNLFIAGILFSVMYLKTLSLWLPLAFHFAWNVIIFFILGSSLSNNYYNDSIFVSNLEELPAWIFGAYSGIEGGLLCTVILIINIIAVLKYFEPSPYVSSLIFKRYYAEGELVYNRKLNRMKGK